MAHSKIENVVELTVGGPWRQGPFQLLGQPVIVHTQSVIRYEGLLHDIDTGMSTVGFSYVLKCGAEESPGNNPEGPRDEVLLSLVLSIEDIFSIESMMEVEEPNGTSSSPPWVETEVEVGAEEQDSTIPDAQASE